MTPAAFKKCASIVIALLFAVLTAAAVWGTAAYTRFALYYADDPVQIVSSCEYTVGAETGSLRLPHSIKPLAPRTPVTLYADIIAAPGDSLFIKTVYSPLRLFAGDTLIYESGQDSSYPAFLLDPPTTVKTIPLDDIATHSPIRLRFEYLSPSQRNVMTVHPVVVGNEAALITRLIKRDGFSLLFALVMIFFGLGLAAVALAFIRTERAIVSVFWLGLFALATGVWVLGECNLTEFLIPNPSLLYVFAFLGLFTLALPLMNFCLATLGLTHKHPLQLMSALLGVAVVTALVLQLAGIVAFSRTMYVFHVLTPVSIIVMAVCVVFEAVRYKNVMARRFIIPVLVLMGFTLLEVLNYQLRFIDVMSAFFQVGAFIFVAMLGVIGGYFTLDALRAKTDKLRLEYSVGLMKAHYSMLRQNAEAVKAQRHDLRHQLTVLRAYGDEGDTQKLAEYIDGLIKKIPTQGEAVLCDNEAVNAVASYYAALAGQQGIEVSVHLDIPRRFGQVQDSDLCVIVGNFLENAIHACQAVPAGERFIRMSSRVHYDTLTVAMDNSMRCTVGGKAEGGAADVKPGTGLSSVMAVAERYGGTARFEINGDVFLSSVYVKKTATD